MARFTLACLALLSVLGIAAAVPLTAQEYGPALAPAYPTCPPSPAPSYEYPVPSQEYYLPGPSMDGMPYEPSPMDMTPSDSDSKVPPSPGQSSDQSTDSSQQPFDAAQMPDLNTQAPDMATPTFNPSSAPTTAATSPESVAPNMIGDLFGTTFSGAVPIRIDQIFAFTDSSLLGPDVDSMSISALTVTDTSDLIISSSPGGFPLATIPMFSTEFSTVDSQADIAADNPLLDGASVPIVNNTDVESEVAMVASSIYGPGTTVFLPGQSNVLLGSGIPMIERDYDPTWGYDYIVFSEAAGLANPGAAPGANVGRQKLAENTSPLPRDRVFVNYSYFKNTPLTAAGTNVNRVTPGFEKTFFGGDMSIEVRAPFAATLDSDVLAGGLTDSSSAEFGNLTMYFKALLWDAGFEAISVGVGLTLPTADDVTLRLPDGTSLLDIENESVHILPFIGALFLPTERLFIQGFLQADIDPIGNPLRFSDFDNGIPTGNLLTAGRPNDADFIFFDVGIGYWIYQAPVCGGCGDCSSGSCGGSRGWIRGIAPTLELHYNGTINEADTVVLNRGSSQIQIGRSERSALDLWNVVLGVNIDLYPNATLTFAYATSVAGERDEQFDSEFRVMFNWFFGGPDRVHTCCF